MGQTFSRANPDEECDNPLDIPAPLVTRSRRKRPASDETDSAIEQLLNTPTSKKLKTTSKYVHETLFVQSQFSDITVEAMGQCWKLHKHFLKQSLYFQSMFSGHWEESSKNHINITIADPNIDTESLNIAFGSLYEDEFTIEPSKVIKILATAVLLQLDALIQKSEEIMYESLNVQTVVGFFEAADTYGLVKMRKNCLLWLRVNLMSHLPEYPNELREVPLEIMKEAIQSTDLFVLQTEFSIYVLLRLWVYLRLHPDLTGAPNNVLKESQIYFLDRAHDCSEYFLETPEGLEYVPIYQQLRLNHIICHEMDMETQIRERIIPQSWMYPIYQKQWMNLLHLDHGVDLVTANVSLADFEKHALRCGRTINNGDTQHMWRWTGFHTGLDLIANYDNYQLTLKRNHVVSSMNDNQSLLSNLKRRNVYCKVNVASYNKQFQPVYTTTSGCKKLSLQKNQVSTVLSLDKNKVTFPLLISFSFLLTQPQPESEQPNNPDEIIVEEVNAQ